MSEGRTDIKKGIFRRVGYCTRFSFSSECSLRARFSTCNTAPRDPPYVTRGRRSLTERVKLEADRGDVLACDGRILATSVPMYEVRMDFAANV